MTINKAISDPNVNSALKRIDGRSLVAVLLLTKCQNEYSVQKKAVFAVDATSGMRIVVLPMGYQRRRMKKEGDKEEEEEEEEGRKYRKMIL